MAKPKNIFVTTASSLEGTKIIGHLGPISTHIVAGTNLFSDIFASFSDVFGGRSSTYQKQIATLYDQAIDELKLIAFEAGANCIIGLRVDLDEVSGKGKSMFMITAIGTAVLVDVLISNELSYEAKTKFKNVSLEKINVLKKKRDIIQQAKESDLKLDTETWEFVTVNQVTEVSEYIIDQLRSLLLNNSDSFQKNHSNAINYFDVFPDEIKSELVYKAILNEKNERLILKLCEIAEKINLVNYDFIDQLMQSDEIKTQKIALRCLTYDKPAYNKSDIGRMSFFIDVIKNKFPIKATKATKKGLLSSKEIEIWVCVCGTKNNNDVTLCNSCFKDIFGFTSVEVSPNKVIETLEEKISLVSSFIE